MPFRTNTYLKLISNLFRIFLTYPEDFLQKFYRARDGPWFNPYVRFMLLLLVVVVMVVSGGGVGWWVHSAH